MEAEIGPLKMIQGNNGSVIWSVDQNGKLRIHSDEKTLREARVDSLIAEYAHLDPSSEVFTVSYSGEDTAFGRPCYVVTIINDITTDTLQYFIDEGSFYRVKDVKTMTHGSQQTVYSDFREVDGVLVPFEMKKTTYPTAQSEKIVLTKVEMDVPVAPALFDPPVEDVADLGFADGAAAIEIPFRFIENHIYLPVVMKGKERLWVLDSGAEITVIEKRFAQEIGVASIGDLKGTGAGNVVDFSFAELPPLSIDDKLFLDGQKGAVFDLYSLLHDLMGLEVAGILGYDFLSRVVTRIDYANERITFYNPDSFVYEGPGVVLDIPLSQSASFNLPLVIDGTYEGLWHLDLGAGGMSFHYPYAASHGLLDRPGCDWIGFGAGGGMKERKVRFDSVEIAGFAVENVLIDVPRQKVEGAFGDAYLTGNIGNDLLRNFVLYLDYKRERVILEKGVDFGGKFPRDNSGLQAKYDSTGAITIFFVAPGTPAAEAGLKTGDVVQSINNIPVERLDGILAFRELLKSPPGTVLELGLLRGGNPDAVALTLRDLYE
jgi:hypothetical protein